MSKGGYKKQRARFVQDEFELEDTEFKQKSHESPHEGRGGSMSEELAMDELDFGEENINKPGKKSKRMSRYQKESLMDEGGGVVSAAAAELTRKMTEMVGAGIREEQFRNIFINAPQYNRQKKFKIFVRAVFEICELVFLVYLVHPANPGGNTNIEVYNCSSAFVGATCGSNQRGYRRCQTIPF
ncbi:hypothetical protein AX774_g4814 [Zancudomyces culisetae]|uniref:Uncharacterized protein n=1 Tax=Zancudomyces culisetae TaxID=1213189 RepID=A0A1R1PL82_ZANCU|nr:hypothetical protein AX774_g4814 [Zancudomyces culisetae]|eukprot:OMH81724.1 hypothetical protein AX774_g4814 [Zancudomyces culisetae]